MRKVFTCIVLMLTAVGAMAKGQNDFTRISGVLNNTDGKHVEAATISLLNATDKKIAKLGLSKADGAFELLNVKPGQYLLQITALGHKAQSMPVVVETGKAELEITVSPLEPVQAKLGDVTVTGRRPLVETKIDRTVVNVDAMISNAGSTAMEVLEKAPGILVDKDGNISLKGKQGVIVLIDGRPSYLSGQDLANMLKNMNSAELDQLEIMTQPPAKFEASGNAGLVNIKTKKSKANGFNGTLSLGYVQGYYPKSPNNFSFNYRKNKVNLFANYGFAYWEGFNEISLLRKIPGNNGLQIFDQVTNGHIYSRNHTLKTGMDFYASKKNTFGLVLNAGMNPRDFYSDGATHISGEDKVVDSTNFAYSNNHDNWKNFGANLNFRRVLDGQGSEWTVDGDYLWYGLKTKQNSDNYMRFPNGNSTTKPPFLLQGNLPANIDIYSIKSDFVKVLPKGAKLEAGVKSSVVKSDNNAMYELYNKDKNSWENDTTRTNRFLYDENINAVYVNYSRQFKGWGLQTGLRMENTNGKGHQVIKNQGFTRHYTQLFPTVYLSRTINEKNTLMFNYGRRIERPNYQDMNPFQYFLDIYTYRQGNPLLMPQFSHNIELSHNYKGRLNTTLNYTFTDDIMNGVLKQNDSTKTTYYISENIGKRHNIGLAVSYNAPLNKWWTISVYANPYYNHYMGVVNNLPVDVKLFAYMLNMNHQFRFAKTWGAELSGFYRSKQQDAGIMMARPMGSVSSALSKQILKGKGSLKLAIADPFWLQKFRGDTKSGNIDAYFRYRGDSRRLGLTFTYRFGKQMQQQAPRRKSGAAEEQKRINTEGAQ